jgi:membrane-associated phospholipid phosphatase
VLQRRRASAAGEGEAQALPAVSRNALQQGERMASHRPDRAAVAAGIVTPVAGIAASAGIATAGAGIATPVTGGGTAARGGRIDPTSPWSRVVWSRLSWPLELILILVGDLLYETLRAMAPSRREVALEHARLLRGLEPSSVTGLENWLNRVANEHAVVAHGFGYYYLFLHVTVTGAVLIWLWKRHPLHYPRARTALFVVTLGALVLFWLFPVAPPRFTVPGTVDTVAGLSMTKSPAGRSTEGLVNDYAAFPSLHVAWAVWCAWAAGLPLRGRRRHLTWLYPALTALIVIATGNHYLIDVLAGAAAVALATWSRRQERTARVAGTNHDRTARGSDLARTSPH